MQFKFYGKIRWKSGFYSSKMFLIMKLTVVLIFISCFHISAKSYSQSINLSGTNLPLEKALTQISEQSGHYLFYKYNEIKEASPVTLNLKNVSLSKALQEILKKSALYIFY